MTRPACCRELRFPELSKKETRVTVVWRDIAIEMPPTFELVGGDKPIEIRDRWRDAQGVCLQLFHPTENRFIDYYVKSVFHVDGSNYVALQLPEGCPTGEDDSHEEIFALCLVRVEAPLIVRTLTESEFEKISANFDFSDATMREIELVLGAIPSLTGPIKQAEQRRWRAAQNTGPIDCINCEKAAGDGIYCVTCGAFRGAPSCPGCRNPVSSNLDERIHFEDENGYYPWHYGWTGRCASCGNRFSSRKEIVTGHSAFFSETARQRLNEAVSSGQPVHDGFFDGKSTVSIEMGESLNLSFDAWDYQPTVVIQVKRISSANMVDENDPDDGSLKQEEKIVLTLAEWRHIKEQLDGPLSVLLARKSWSRDTT